MLKRNAGESKLYRIEQSINPIIAAASPIISMINRLYDGPEPESWQDICQHELNICLKHCSDYDKHELEQIKSIIISWINSVSAWQLNIPHQAYSSSTFMLLTSEPDKNLYILELLFILNRLGLALDDNPSLNELKSQELYYLIRSKKQEQQYSLQKQDNLAKWLNDKRMHKANNKHWQLFASSTTLLCCWALWLFWQDSIIILGKMFILALP